MEKYIALNYYKNFKCKTKDCRSVCCKGWTVSVTLDEYFKVTNLEADSMFREKLDRGFYINLKPTNEKYATLRKDYYGDCVFHGEDGLCEIHKNYGENKIPSVCRLYPRNISKEFALEKSCSNSCEKVLEMMFETSDKLYLETLDDTETVINYNDEYVIKRKHIIDLLQKEISFDEKLNEISKYLFNEEYSKKVDYQKLFEYLKLYNKTSVVSSEITDDVTEILKKHKYEDLQKSIYQKYKDFDIYMDRYIINHMFFTFFPYDKLKGILKHSIDNLHGVYYLTKYICIILTHDKESISDLVDIMCKLYRLIGHSEFYKYVGLCLTN